jgi:plastocyanin
MLHRFRCLLVCVAGVALAFPAWATMDTVVVSSFQFTPAHITISHGDTIVWHCTSGFHNVHHLGTPSLFGNSAASAPWYYQFVFSSVGDSTFHYECQVHPTQMQGTVTVQPANVAPKPRATGNAGEFTLAQNYPNPFNSQTIIQFTVPTESNVRITVLDILGQTIRRVFAGNVAAGQHNVPFNADGLPSGVYFYRLEAPGTMLIRKMSYLK